MKKLILTYACLMAGLAMALAQTATLTLRPVKKGEGPKEVMAEIKKDVTTQSVHLYER